VFDSTEHTTNQEVKYGLAEEYSMNDITRHGHGRSVTSDRYRVKKDEIDRNKPDTEQLQLKTTPQVKDDHHWYTVALTYTRGEGESGEPCRIDSSSAG
jgi:hypothetical protein